MKYLKPKFYNGGNLKGDWLFTRKIDGVRAFITKDGVISRAGKPLYNLDHLIDSGHTDIEVFCGSWEETITMVRSSTKTFKVPDKFIYPLTPKIDNRLVIGTFTDPTEDVIYDWMHRYNQIGDEGLVIRQGDKWFKVKPYETYDVPITEVIEGKGKYKGMLGAFMTPKGKVGTGFNDAQRKELFNPALVGTMIEVFCFEITKDGKFKNPSFSRVRYDK